MICFPPSIGATNASPGDMVDFPATTVKLTNKMQRVDNTQLTKHLWKFMCIINTGDSRQMSFHPDKVKYTLDMPAKEP
ncbi:UNVERIFIED_CONTAM: hypothetical protein K2H54_053403 [Gekko kuhli]